MMEKETIQYKFVYIFGLSAWIDGTAKMKQDETSEKLTS